MTLDSFNAFTVTVTPQSVRGSVISSKNGNYKKKISPGLYPNCFHQENILVNFDLRRIKDWTSLHIGLKSQSIIGLESERLNQLPIYSTIDSVYL